MYEINEEAIQFLNSIKGPVSVVTIAGEFRSGKSYLLSALIGQIGAFKIGHTYKGVYIPILPSILGFLL